MATLLIHDGVGLKRCNICRLFRSPDKFGSNGNGLLKPACRDCHNAKKRADYANGARVAKLASQERYRASKTPQWHSERNRRWREANPDYYSENIDRTRATGRIKAATRRAAIAQVESERIDPAVVYERSEGICGICREPVSADNFHVDHIVSLARGGAHLYSNVQAAHPLCNMKKGAK